RLPRDRLRGATSVRRLGDARPSEGKHAPHDGGDRATPGHAPTSEARMAHELTRAAVASRGLQREPQSRAATASPLRRARRRGHTSVASAICSLKGRTMPRRRHTAVLLALPLVLAACGRSNTTTATTAPPTSGGSTNDVAAIDRGAFGDLG